MSSRCPRRANPFDQVLAKLDEIIATVAPPAGPVRLATPPVPINNQFVYCTIANIGTQNVEVLVTMLNYEGLLAHETSQLPSQKLLVMKPGHSEIMLVADEGLLRCEFEFHGSATSVRAALQYHDSGEPKFSVDAR